MSLIKTGFLQLVVSKSDNMKHHCVYYKLPYLTWMYFWRDFQTSRLVRGCDSDPWYIFYII